MGTDVAKTSAGGGRSTCQLILRLTLGVFIGAMVFFALGGAAVAQVPEDEVTEGNGNVYAHLDSTQSGGPTPFEPAYMPGIPVPNNSTTDPGETLGDSVDGEGSIDLGFDFVYYGVTYTDADTITVGANGAITLTPGSALQGISFFNSDLASTSSVPIIAPFWDDFAPVICGDVFYEIAGAAPNRVAIIGWSDVCDFGVAAGTTDGYTFQVRLFETTNVIEFHYSDVLATTGSDESDQGQSATIGLGGGPNTTPGTSPFMQYAFNRTTAPLALGTDGFAIRFTSTCTTTGAEDAVDVATAAELEAAIACYNVQQPAGNHTITLTSDLQFDADNPGATPINSGTNAGDLTIDGAGFAITGPRGADGAGTDVSGSIDLITITNPGPTTAISNLAVNGADALGIRMTAGAITITNTTVHHNDLDGIAVSGTTTTTITNTTVHHNGLNGIAVSGTTTTTITDTTVHNNMLQGIRVGGGTTTTTITNTIVHDNGGVGIAAGGGTTAIVIANATVRNNGFYGISTGGSATTATIINTTVNNNSFAGIRGAADRTRIINTTIHDNAGTGIITFDGATIISNTTIHDNDSEGIAVFGGSVRIDSSIVSESNTGTGCIGAAGADIDGRNNFVSGTGCPSGFTPLTAGSLAAGLDDNGCTATGCTQTVALLAGSNAVGGGKCSGVSDAAGNPIILDFDQRGPGFARTVNIGCDAGAFEVDCVNPFADVDPGLFFTDPVVWAACGGVTTGTAVGPPAIFSPGGPVTRSQMATFLWRYAGRPAPTGAPHVFTDVPDAQFFSVPIQWLSENGITTGTGDGTTFSPNDTVTRAQMATFLWRFQGEPPAPDHSFADVPDGIFFDVPVAWLAATGITTGTGDGTTFSPDNTLTRAQGVTFLHRLATLPP